MSSKFIPTFAGHKHSEASKKAIGDSCRGKPIPEERKLYGVRNGMYNKKHKDETKKLIGQNCMGEKNGFYNKKHTAETIQRMREVRTQWFIDHPEKKAEIVSSLKNGKAEKHARYGISPRSRKQTEFYDYKGLCVDGTWEVAYLEFLDSNGIVWEKNKQRIYLEDERGKFTTCPDYLVNGELVDVTGWIGPRKKRIIAALERSPIKVKLLTKDILISLGVDLSNRNIKRIAREYTLYIHKKV